MTIQASAHSQKLAEAVLSLSLPGAAALASIPDGPHRADRLALLFDEEYTDFMDAMAVLPTEAQLLALQELDRKLNAISGPSHLELWTDAAVENDPQWDEIRRLADTILRAFGWPMH